MEGRHDMASAWTATDGGASGDVGITAIVLAEQPISTVKSVKRNQNLAYEGLESLNDFFV